MDIQATIHQTADATGLPLARVLQALIIAACRPKPLPERAGM
jgi:hypothetical protein